MRIGNKKRLNHNVRQHILLLCRMLGTQRKLAGLLQISPSNISNWINGTHDVPIKHVVKMTKLSEGKVKMRDLRPDVFDS